MIKFITSWFMLFLLLYILSKTRSGHTVIYYLAWSTVIFMVVSHYQEIGSLLPFQQAKPAAQSAQSI